MREFGSVEWSVIEIYPEDFKLIIARLGALPEAFPSFGEGVLLAARFGPRQSKRSARYYFCATFDEVQAFDAYALREGCEASWCICYPGYRAEADFYLGKRRLHIR